LWGCRSIAGAFLEHCGAAGAWGGKGGTIVPPIY